MNNNVFESFNEGTMKLPDKDVNFIDIPWSKHPTFEGVELKHIVTSKDTNGQWAGIHCEDRVTMERDARDRVSVYTTWKANSKCLYRAFQWEL